MWLEVGSPQAGKNDERHFCQSPHGGHLDNSTRWKIPRGWHAREYSTVFPNTKQVVNSTSTMISGSVVSVHDGFEPGPGAPKLPPTLLPWAVGAVLECTGAVAGFRIIRKSFSSPTLTERIPLILWMRKSPRGINRTPTLFTPPTKAGQAGRAVNSKDLIGWAGLGWSEEACGGCSTWSAQIPG